MKQYSNGYITIKKDARNKLITLVFYTIDQTSVKNIDIKHFYNVY